MLKQININFNGKNAPRHLKAVKNTINTVLSGHAERDAVEKMFYDSSPKTVVKQVENVCIERTAHPQLGWLFSATYYENPEKVECPKFIK